VEGRRQALQASLAADTRKVAGILEKTRQLKLHVEQSLAADLKRPVLVVGEINAIGD
jgi:hypothetical protein